MKKVKRFKYQVSSFTAHCVSLLFMHDGLSLFFLGAGGLHAFDRGHILSSAAELYFEVCGENLGLQHRKVLISPPNQQLEPFNFI